MKKTFFFVLVFFTIQGAFAQENILVEYFRYNQDSAKYELKKTILREYEEGVEPIFDYSDFSHHPLSSKLILRAFVTDGGEVSVSYNTSEYWFENCFSVSEYSSDGLEFDRTYVFDSLSNFKRRKISSHQRIKLNNGTIEIEEGLFLFDSTIFNLEKDKYQISWIRSIIGDWTNKKCEFLRQYTKEIHEIFTVPDGEWKLYYDFNECDSIIDGAIFGHIYNLDNGDSSIVEQFSTNIVRIDSATSNYSNKIFTESVKNSFSSDSVTQFHQIVTGKGLLSEHLYQTEIQKSYTSSCISNICYEYDENKRLTKIFIDADKPTISVGRYYYDNYSLGFEIDTITGEEVILDSMVMHRNYIITSSEKSLQNKNQSEISIFPNPSSGIINIQLENMDPFNAEVFDIQGRSIRKEEGIGSLQLSNLDKGSYIIKLITSHGVSTQRVEIIE